MMRTPARLLVALTLLLSWAGGLDCVSAADGAARPVSVAAAADLKFAMSELIEAFGRTHPQIGVTVTYGSSGTFLSQISNGAPFDLFFSADADYPRRLAEAGLGTKDGVFLYAVGRIVVWVPAASRLDVGRGLQVLASPDVRKVAIANPRHAPYGRAAEAALRALGVYEEVKEKLVFGENVAQAAQFVQSGAADAGVIAPALAKEGRYFEVPLEAYPRIEQGGIILGRARDLEAARALRDFILGPEGRATLKRHGFFLPGP